jgi:hypothetical protein
VRRRMERNEGEEGEKEAVRKRMERKVRKVVRRTTTLINKMVDSEGKNCFENL